MRWKTWLPAGAAGLAVLVAVGVLIAVSGGDEATSGAQDLPASTAQVERGDLAAMLSLNGILTYRARPDGSPYSVINQGDGTYTELPETGDKVECGDVFYRIDDEPVLLLCGPVPAYRDLYMGDSGPDVRQLNRNLHRLGYDAEAGVDIDPDEDGFRWETQDALEGLQDDKGLEVTGSLPVDDAVFQSRPVRISKVTGSLGRPARPGAQVAQATSDTLVVQVDLDASQQGKVKKDDRARITLPGNESMKGEVERIGSVAETDGKEGDAGYATIPILISLDDQSKARGLDSAPVQVEIATKGVKNALNVPVTSLVGKSGGGFAVEVVRGDRQNELVPVTLGLFDSSGGRVQVQGDLDEGDQVVVPSL